MSVYSLIILYFILIQPLFFRPVQKLNLQTNIIESEIPEKQLSDAKADLEQGLITDEEFQILLHAYTKQ